MARISQKNRLKAGTAVLIGRPSVGKSTLLNAILGQKISITSPKPQTTRFPIQGLYNDQLGQILFIDTPGIFEKVEDQISRKINPLAEKESGKADVILYVVDHTRKPGSEEAKILGIIRKINKPKILVVNKIDIKSPSYEPFYSPQEEECQKKIKVSALNGSHIKSLIEVIFDFLPEGKPFVNPEKIISPAFNLTPENFVAEIIREKAFLIVRKEVPYTLTVKVDELTEREKGNFYIKATIYVLDDRYKKMIIGKKGKTIKSIGSQARKELEIITGQPVFLDLWVETNKHWPEMFL